MPTTTVDLFIVFYLFKSLVNTSNKIKYYMHPYPLGIILTLRQKHHVLVKRVILHLKLSFILTLGFPDLANKNTDSRLKVAVQICDSRIDTW